jgi:transcriptional regulator with XRE-family HTH domain
MYVDETRETDNLLASPAQCADRLRLTRVLHRIPLGSLAREAGLSKALVCKVELGRRTLTPEVRRKLYAALLRLIRMREAA